MPKPWALTCDFDSPWQVVETGSEAVKLSRSPSMSRITSQALAPKAAPKAAAPASKSELTEPEPTNPNPEATNPEATDPEATDPEATDPEATDPGFRSVMAWGDPGKMKVGEGKGKPCRKMYTFTCL